MLLAVSKKNVQDYTKLTGQTIIVRVKHLAFKRRVVVTSGRQPIAPF